MPCENPYYAYKNHIAPQYMVYVSKQTTPYVTMLFQTWISKPVNELWNQFRM